MKNYELAKKLVEKGIAEKHNTFNDTGIIIIDLGGNYCGYADPCKKCIEITGSSNSVVDRGNLSDDLKQVVGAGRSYNVQSW